MQELKCQVAAPARLELKHYFLQSNFAICMDMVGYIS